MQVNPNMKKIPKSFTYPRPGHGLTQACKLHLGDLPIQGQGRVNPAVGVSPTLKGAAYLLFESLLFAICTFRIQSLTI
jgi:hypothetical protein